LSNNFNINNNYYSLKFKNKKHIVYATESPRVIASVQRRIFSDKFRNFVDLCAQRQADLRPTATQLLQHAYLKKIKLTNVTSTLRVSVLSDGIIELQKKLQNIQLMKQLNKNGTPMSSTLDSLNLASNPTNANVVWEF
jgi:hypothetical protein